MIISYIFYKWQTQCHRTLCIFFMLHLFRPIQTFYIIFCWSDNNLIFLRVFSAQADKSAWSQTCAIRIFFLALNRSHHFLLKKSEFSNATWAQWFNFDNLKYIAEKNWVKILSYQVWILGLNLPYYILTFFNK